MTKTGQYLRHSRVLWHTLAVTRYFCDGTVGSVIRYVLYVAIYWFFIEKQKFNVKQYKNKCFK